MQGLQSPVRVLQSQVRGYALAFVFIAQPIVIASLAFVFNAQRIVFAALPIVFTALEIANAAQVLIMILFRFNKYVLALKLFAQWMGNVFEGKFLTQ